MGPDTLNRREATEPRPARPIDTIGPYHILRTLRVPDFKNTDPGRFIWLAEDPQSGEKMVIKSQRLSKEPEYARDRLRHEYNTFDLLHTPGDSRGDVDPRNYICRPLGLFEIKKDDGKRELYIRLPYIGPRTIRDMDASRELDLIARVLVQATTAVEYMHKRDVFHLDIKPGNFVLDPRNNPDGSVVKLIDLECARRKGGPYVLFDDEHFATDGYASPEQIEGRYPTEKQDVFSLGAVIFYALTGSSPFVTEGTEGSPRSPKSPFTNFDHPLYEQPEIARKLARFGSIMGNVTVQTLAKEPGDRPGIDLVVATCRYFADQVERRNLPRDPPEPPKLYVASSRPFEGSA